jgi:NADPH:quinone reductase-like Zn-dependent oxidoreductase
MRAIRYHKTGDPEVLVLEDVPQPQPGPGEVLVRVHAAGVNPLDTLNRRGTRTPPLPAIPGYDLAGTVESTGPGVGDFAPGQAVFGMGEATYADYAVAPALSLATKPSSITFYEGAAVGMGARTAWGALLDLGDLRPGQRVLIHGAAGGVGVFAVQLAKAKGAEVIGTCSTANLELVRSLGADQVIDYTSTAFDTVVRDVDIVLDTVGGETTDRSYGVLKAGGLLAFIAGRPAPGVAEQHGVRLVRPTEEHAPPDFMRHIAQMIEAGMLRPLVRQVLPLADARKAHMLSETGHGAGRIVLRIAD